MFQTVKVMRSPADIITARASNPQSFEQGDHFNPDGGFTSGRDGGFISGPGCGGMAGSGFGFISGLPGGFRGVPGDGGLISGFPGGWLGVGLGD